MSRSAIWPPGRGYCNVCGARGNERGGFEDVLCERCERCARYRHRTDELLALCLELGAWAGLEDPQTKAGRP